MSQFLKRLSLLISSIQDFSTWISKGHPVVLLQLKKWRGKAEGWEGMEGRQEVPSIQS